MEQRKTSVTPYIDIENDNNNERKKYDNIFNRKCCAVYSCVIGAIIVCGFLFVDKNCDVFTHDMDVCDLPSYCSIKDECHGSNLI